MLDHHTSLRGTLERSLSELDELKEELRTRTARVGARAAQYDTLGTTRRRVEPSVASCNRSALGSLCLPPEVVDSFLWHLDLASLGRSTCTGREWMRLARAKPRWRKLCHRDWGMDPNGSWPEYRDLLGRWHVLTSVFISLKESRCPSGICGSQARRRLAEALDALVGFGAAPGWTARYPAQLPALLPQPPRQPPNPITTQPKIHRTMS